MPLKKVELRGCKESFVEISCCPILFGVVFIILDYKGTRNLKKYSRFYLLFSNLRLRYFHDLSAFDFNIDFYGINYLYSELKPKRTLFSKLYNLCDSGI